MIWLFFSLVYTFLERGIIGDLDYYPATGNSYSFLQNIIVTPISAMVMGLLIGILEVFWLGNAFIQRSFTEKIVYKSFIYVGIIVFFLVSSTVVANLVRMSTGIGDKQVWNDVGKFFRNYAFISLGIFVGAITLVVQFYTEVSESIGQKVLSNFLTGQYHRPKEEERIFMFLDLRSSTTIAEKLGHLRYFEMLREYYADISGAIIDHSGEVYQYAGDEIIVSWLLPKGLRNNRCLECFFAIKDIIKVREEKYVTRFGHLPGFKAGFHYGMVTTGEIGVIKKEILFTGDVLNTTARIQGLCNSYSVDLLISGQLLSRLNPGPDLVLKELGSAELRGRQEKITLYTVERGS
jgi:class 3 adenylate cyclase